MLERTILTTGIVALLVAGFALAADPPVPPSRDAATPIPAQEEMMTDTPPKASPNRPQSPPARASASASASASATSRTGSGATDCAADASASVERDGERITAQRSLRTQDGATGCHAEARAHTDGTPRE